MNKKGFTLVELLAVIAILAILVIIALPNVLQMFNDSKRNSFLNEVRNLYNQARNQWITDSMKGNIGGLYSSKDISEGEDDCGTQLDLQGRDLSYSIAVNNKGEVTILRVSDGTYSYIANNVKDASAITIDDIKDFVPGESYDGGNGAYCAMNE